MNYTGCGRKLSVLIEALSQRLPEESEENYEKTFPGQIRTRYHPTLLKIITVTLFHSVIFDVNAG